MEFYIRGDAHHITWLLGACRFSEYGRHSLRGAREGCTQRRLLVGPAVFVHWWCSSKAINKGFGGRVKSEEERKAFSEQCCQPAGNHRVHWWHAAVACKTLERARNAHMRAE